MLAFCDAAEIETPTSQVRTVVSVLARIRHERLRERRDEWFFDHAPGCVGYELDAEAFELGDSP